MSDGPEEPPPEPETDPVGSAPRIDFSPTPEAIDADAIDPDPLDTAAQDEQRRKQEEELSLLRIRQVSGSRRSALRTRTYLYIAFVLTATAFVQLIIKAVDRYRTVHRIDLWCILFTLLACVFPTLCWRSWRAARAITRELNQPLIQEPTTPPDFSTLSDGSQTAKDLEDVR